MKTEEDIKNIRLNVLKMVSGVGEGHIPSAFSVIEILYSLYSHIGGNDAFFLSKGHASAGFYAVLAHFGLLERRELDTFCEYKSVLGGHPSNTISAPLAIAEAVRAGGKSLITAIALGYEMYVPFIEGTAKIKSKFEQDGLMATLGSAMAAGKILDLTEEQLATTASLALVPNVGLGMRRVGKVSMYKEVYAGMAARQGIFAALMARVGMTAPEDAIESGEGGLKHVVMEGGILELGLLGGKGKQFMVDRTVIKAFPIGGGVHLSVKAALELRKKVRADEIASIIVKTESYGAKSSAKPEHWAPKTRETADHSIPVAVAMALIDGNISAESWKRERYKAPEVTELVSKIRVEEKPEFTKQFPAKKNIVIEARTHSGDTRMVHKVMTPEEEKTTNEVIEAKFLRYADDVLTSSPASAEGSLPRACSCTTGSGRISSTTSRIGSGTS